MSELPRVTEEKGTCGHRGRCGTWVGRGEEFTVNGGKIAREGTEKKKGDGGGRKRETEFVRQCSARAHPIPSCKWDSQLVLFIFC